MFDPSTDWTRALMRLALIVLLEMLALWWLLGEIEQAERQDDEDGP
jgi:hypothetical protein